MIAHLIPGVFLLLFQGQAVTSSISGVVLVAGTSTPVPHARINIAGQPSAQMEADDSGHFILRGLPPGKYRLIARRDGFMPGPSRSKEDIVLGPGQEVNDAVVRLVANGAIGGRVWNSNGDPVPGAKVQILRYTYQDGRRILIAANTTTSDERGDYAFPSLAPGPYVVSTASRDTENSLPVYYPGTTDIAAAATIELSSGVNMNGVDLRLTDTQPVRVRGQVTNVLTGQPVPGASVMLVPRRGTASIGSLRRTVSSANGIFEFAHMAPSSYDIVATIGESGSRLAGDIAIDIGSADIDNINLVLQQQFTVTGRIRFQDPGMTMNFNNIRVDLRREPFTPELLIILPTIAPDGTFTFFGVTPGDYQLKVNAGGDFVKAANIGGINALNPPFHVDAGAGPLDIVLSMNTASVDAFVVDDKQNPVDDATVILVPEPPLRSRTDLYEVGGTDASGRVHLKGITPGDYRVFAWDDIPGDAWQDSDFLRPYESRGRLIHVSEAGSETVQLDLISHP